MRKSFLAPCSSHSLTICVAGLPWKGPGDKPGYSNTGFLPTEAKKALKKGILNFGKLLAHHNSPSATEPNSGGRDTLKSLSRLFPTATALPCLGDAGKREVSSGSASGSGWRFAVRKDGECGPAGGQRDPLGMRYQRAHYYLKACCDTACKTLLMYC